MTARLFSRNDLIACMLVCCVIILLALFVDRPLALLLKAYDQSHPGALDIFKSLTHLGNSKWYLWPTGLGTLGCLGFAWFRRGDAVFYERCRRYALLLGFIFACVALSGLLVDLFKIIFGRSRPVLLGEDGIYAWAPFTHHSRWASFPSGHSNTAFALAFALSTLWTRWRWLFLTGAALVAMTRFIITAHFLGDILAGALVAAITTAMIAAMFVRRNWLHT